MAQYSHEVDLKILLDEYSDPGNPAHEEWYGFGSAMSRSGNAKKLNRCPGDAMQDHR